MEKVDVIKITKEFEKENVVNAVKAYMTPKNADFRLASECVGETYIVQLLGKKKKMRKAQKQQLPGEWVENCSVKLAFDEDTCTVGIFFKTYGASENLVCGAAGMAMGAGIGIPVMIGLAVLNGSNAVGAKRFRKDILKIVESFICDETIIEEGSKKKKALREKETASEDSVYVCSCGKKLEKNQKFCPECGTQRDDGVRICTCGQQVEKSMKFCPYCGAVCEQ